MAVIEERSEVFVTKEYFEQRLENEWLKLEERLDEKRRASERRAIAITLTGVALLLVLFEFVLAV